MTLYNYWPNKGKIYIEKKKEKTVKAKGDKKKITLASLYNTLLNFDKFHTE